MVLQPAIFPQISLQDFATRPSTGPDAMARALSQVTKVPRAPKATVAPATRLQTGVDMEVLPLGGLGSPSLFRLLTAARPLARTITARPKYQPRRGVVLEIPWILITSRIRL